MSSGFYEAIAIGVVGIIILISMIRFVRSFYVNPQKAMQLIRLSRKAYLIFTLFLSMNFVFAVGYILQILSEANNYDLVAILIYALGTAIFFTALSSVISKKYLP
ncbi:MAG: hypothetical protein BJBARM5_0615 [Candidatus Parvarchaeum acidophilus ARMAN-5]|jgi:hypothetical protein|uniref:Uncharacterized protein n=1 Tax=Candidatus Parvarchaeum acidophilus ARMAN-5 TaxID=662762 RepID=D6GVU6_PARA5|nr:MAG: hypothetical protein BJBARM5_0615 [Candidatus Parvarchaeum acidophilus ARMAN-5]